MHCTGPGVYHRLRFFVKLGRMFISHLPTTVAVRCIHFYRPIVLDAGKHETSRFRYSLSGCHDSRIGGTY